MDGKTLARLGAVVFVAVAITATMIELTKQETVPATAPVLVPRQDTDALHQRQRRCQQLGLTAAEDRECLRVWAETRDRFLGRATKLAGPHVQEGR